MSIKIDSLRMQKKMTINGIEEEGYIVRPVSVGNVSITFLPMDIR